MHMLQMQRNIPSSDMRRTQASKRLWDCAGFTSMYQTKQHAPNQAKHCSDVSCKKAEEPNTVSIHHFRTIQYHLALDPRHLQLPAANPHGHAQCTTLSLLSNSRKNMQQTVLQNADDCCMTQFAQALQVTAGVLHYHPHMLSQPLQQTLYHSTTCRHA